VTRDSEFGKGVGNNVAGADCRAWRDRNPTLPRKAKAAKKRKELQKRSQAAVFWWPICRGDFFATHHDARVTQYGVSGYEPIIRVRPCWRWFKLESLERVVSWQPFLGFAIPRDGAATSGAVSFLGRWPATAFGNRDRLDLRLLSRVMLGQ